MATFSDLFVVNSNSSAPLNANAPSGDATTQVSNFVTVQSLGTFAIATAVLKTVWELLQGLFGGWADSYWTPLAICLIYGAWQLAVSLTGPQKVTGTAAVLSACMVGLANSAVLAASIIGLTETTGAGET